MVHPARSNHFLQASDGRGRDLRVPAPRLATPNRKSPKLAGCTTKRLGVLALQHGVCLLPRTVQTQTAYTQLVRRIEDYGGEAIVLTTSSPDDRWHAKTVARFNAARDEEYEEVVDETERFREEIARERRKGKFTFAELEDEETNLERL